MDSQLLSQRAKAVRACNGEVFDYFKRSRYAERRRQPSVCDFTFGNPHELP